MRQEQDAEGVGSLTDGGTYRSGNPFGVWRWMREHHPVLRHDAGEFGTAWSVTRYADVKEVLRRADVFSSAAGTLLRPVAQGTDPGGDRTLALSDAPRHTELRGVLADWFTPRRLRARADSLDEAARAAVTDAVEKGETDFVTGVAAKLPLAVMWTLLGIPHPDRAMLTHWCLDAFCADTAVARTTAHLEILGYFGDLAAERRARPAEDLVSVLARARTGGRPLPLEDTVLNCDNLLVGGTENVRLTLAGGVQALMAHPDQWATLRRDPGRIPPTAIEEILRWTSSATHLVRTATHDTRLGNRTIGRGERLVLWLPSANRDSAEFRDPDAFDLTRTPNRHIAFGAGPHHCIGVQLARAQLRAVLGQLSRAVRRIEPCGPAERLESVIVNGFRSLPVRLLPV
ncbi:cytochrome P450 [Streptomyces sp. NPDC047061]|uniref:cytochrome P450 n=1 Tax=Streptomyces sp. NPDC047061 TaxID=3154605 RepID=UPI00340A92B9